MLLHFRLNWLQLTKIMHLSTLLVALGACSALAAPLEQQPIADSPRKHAGPHKVKNPYKPGYYDEWDRKIDSQGDKLAPEPVVRFPAS